MDPATDCTPTGEMVPCGVGAMVATFDCTYHLDLWHFPDDRNADMPHGTLDSDLYAVPACGATQPNLLLSTGLTQHEVARHHLIAPHPMFPDAVLALQNDADPQDPRLRPAIALGATGAQAAPDLAGLAVIESWRDGWITLSDKAAFACARGRCTDFNVLRPRQFDAPAVDFTVLGSVTLYEGGLVVFGRRNDPEPAIVAATIPCVE
jgi:hypothetical protein